MKQHVLLALVVALANTSSAVDSSPKSKITSATKQLGEKTNYSWTSTSKEADGST